MTNNDSLGRFNHLLDDEDPASHAEAFFGEECLLAKSFRNPFQHGGGLADLAKDIQALAGAGRNQLMRWGLMSSEEKEPRVSKILGALSDVAAAAATLTNAPGDMQSAQVKIFSAISQFDQIWPSTPPCAHPANPSFFTRPSDVVKRAFEGFDAQCAPLGFCVTWDLIDRLVTNNKHGENSVGADAPVSLWAETPIVGAAPGDQGEILLLRVELVPCDHGWLCPDPMYLVLCHSLILG